MDPTNKKLATLRKKAKLVLKPKVATTVSDTDAVKKTVVAKKTKAKLQLKPSASHAATKPKSDKKVKTSDVRESVPRPTLQLKPSVSRAAKTHIKKPKTPDYLYTDKLLSSAEKLEYIKGEHSYEYPIRSALDREFDTLTLDSSKTIYHCVYQINMSSVKPFLQYLLYKFPEDKGDKLIFPYKKYSGTDSLVDFSKKFIKKIIPAFDSSIECDGFLEHGSKIFVFYNIGQIVNKVNKNTRSNKWWWSLIYEIVNIKSVLNFPVHSITTQLFIMHKELNYLYATGDDDEKERIEIPNVGYHGTYYTLAPLIETYGIKASSLYSMMGPYYYFGSYRKAIRYAGWTSTYKPRYVNDVLISDADGRYISIEDPEKGNPGVIIRCAMFLGKPRVFLNHPEDVDDLSEEELKEEEMKTKKSWKYLTRKLHDYKGKWTEDYNSAYLGRVRLENGALAISNPEIILHNFDQHIILSSHSLDKSTLLPNWDAKYDKYYIV